MLLGNYFANIDSSKKKFFFQEFHLTQKILKKIIFFLLLKGTILMEINLFLMQLKKGLKLLSARKELQIFKKISYSFILKI